MMLDGAMQKAVKSIHKQFLAFVIANVITCVLDTILGFFESPGIDSSTISTAVMHFLENVIVLAPINYVLFVHRRSLITEKAQILRNDKIDVTYESIQRDSSFKPKS